MIVPAGVPVNVTATFNNPTPGFVAFSVYDDTGTSPVLLLSPVVMTQVVGNTYRGKFTPTAGKLYVVFMGVYTDGTFTVLDPSFATQEVAVGVSPLFLSPPVQSVVGLVGCNNPDLEPVCPFTIFLGNSKTMYFRVLNATLGLIPLDLTNCTEISVALPNADGTLTRLLLSLGKVSITQPANLGQFSAPISDVLSALLNVGEFQNVDVTFTIGGTVFTVRFLQALSVFEIA